MLSNAALSIHILKKTTKTVNAVARRGGGGGRGVERKIINEIPDVLTKRKWKPSENWV